MVEHASKGFEWAGVEESSRAEMKCTGVRRLFVQFEAKLTQKKSAMAN